MASNTRSRRNDLDGFPETSGHVVPHLAALGIVNVLGNSHEVPLSRTNSASGSAAANEVRAYVAGRPVYYFTGHGAKNQIMNTKQLIEDTKTVAEDLNQRHGGQRTWIACYGGDEYQPKAPDIAHVMKELHASGVPVMTIQCADYKDYMCKPNGTQTAGHKSSYDFLDAAVFYVTEHHKTKVDAKGRPQILYGGHEQGFFDPEKKPRLRGSTWHLFNLLSSEDADAEENTLAGVVGFGGGPIACEEFRICYRAGLKCLYVPTKARYKQVAATPVKDAYKIDISASPESYGPIALELARDGLDKFFLHARGPVQKQKPITRRTSQITFRSMNDSAWMTFKAGTEEDIKSLPVHAESGLYYKQYISAGQKKPILPMWELYSSPKRKKYNIAISVMEIRSINDVSNTYDAEFYLTLVDCNDGPANKSNAPYLEWKNSVGAPKSQESEQSITEIWNAKVDRLNADVESLVEEGASQEKITAAKAKHVKLSMGFECTFIIPNRTSVLSFPYDYQELSIQICTDEPKNCEFRPARPNPGILKSEALQTLQNWVGVREKTKQSEMNKTTMMPFLTFSFQQAFACLQHVITWPWTRVKPIFVSEKKKTDEVDADVWEHWMLFRQHRTSATSSAEGNVYGLITCSTVLLRESGSLTNNLIIPSTMLGLATLFQYWIHPLEVGERSGFIITMMLSVLALKLAVSTLVPPLSRATFLDEYLFHNLLFPFLVGGMNVIASRNCLPSCEPQHCTFNRDDFEFPMFGTRHFEKETRVDYARDNYEVQVVSKIDNTSTWVPFCECKCGTDDYIFYAASAYYILLHVTFMYAFLQTRFQFQQILERSNLEVHRVAE